MKNKLMCPHCGLLIRPDKDSLIPYHYYHADQNCQTCPGSKQNPRCAESDRRLLWNGEKNPYAE